MKTVKKSQFNSISKAHTQTLPNNKKVQILDFSPDDIAIVKTAVQDSVSNISTCINYICCEGGHESSFFNFLDFY